MSAKKFIIVGCDGPASLYTILYHIPQSSFLDCQFVSTSRVHDLKDLSRSLNPELIVLFFSNMSMLIKDIHRVNPDIPVLCIVSPLGSEVIWDRANIVFTCNQEDINRTGHLELLINSILTLRNKPEPAKSIAAINYTAQKSALQPDNLIDNRSLSRYVMELDQKVELLAKIKERLNKLFPQVSEPVRLELTSILNSIKKALNDEKLWDDFKVFFEKSDPEFLQKLSKKYPELTPVDLKYCCYLKMNMSNDDIRNLLGINQESVRMHKYRLKKKMSLTPNQNLKNFLVSIN